MPEPFTPPAEHAHHRWHTVQTEWGRERIGWDGRQWFADGLEYQPSEAAMWRYIAPAIPPASERESENV